MSRKPRVQTTPEEKWQIVLESLKSGNVAETWLDWDRAMLGVVADQISDFRKLLDRHGNPRALCLST